MPTGTNGKDGVESPLADLPDPVSRCNRQWLCTEFLPRLQGGATVGLRLFLRLLEVATPLLSETPTCASFDDTRVPVLVVGPLRGHTDVAATLVTACGRHPTLSVVFLGDYVDGGANSVEALCIALATLVALGPRRVAVLRGRHEHLFPAPRRWSGTAEARFDVDLRWRCVQFLATAGGDAAVASSTTNGADEKPERTEEEDDGNAAGIEDEDEDEDESPAAARDPAARRLISEVEERVRAAFLAMPLAAHVHSSLFCVSGGPSCALPQVADINATVDRAAEFGTAACGPVHDLVLSEVADEDEDQLAVRENVAYARNPEVGFGAMFTHAAACHFLAQNRLHSIVRGSLMPLHAEPPLVSLACRSSNGKWSPYDAGVRFGRATPIGTPTTITLFSAPRLAGRAHNYGAVLWVKESLVSVHQFGADPARPPQLPRGHRRSAFDWSFPLLVQHLLSALTHIALPSPDEARADAAAELAEDPVAQERAAKAARFRRLCTHEKRQHGDLAAVRAALRGDTGGEGSDVAASAAVSSPA